MVQLVLACGPKQAKKEQAPKAKYVFLFIGGGLGTEQLHAAQLLRTLERRKTLKSGMESLGFTEFTSHGLVSTQSVDGIVTDSAASATAFATGHKTRNGYLGLAEDGETALTSVAEIARDDEMKVGIVTTVSLDQAVSAAFFAHQRSHLHYYEIARDLTLSRFNFFAAGGFLEPTPPAEERPDRPESDRAFDVASSVANALAPAGTPSSSAEAQFSSAPGRNNIEGGAIPNKRKATEAASASASASSTAPTASASGAPSAITSATRPVIPAPRKPKKPHKPRRQLPIIQLLADNQYLVAKSRLSRGELLAGAPESGDEGMQVVPSVLEPVLQQSQWSILTDENLDELASLPFAIDRPKTSPGLADYTKKAIQKLEGPEGFFLMVTGGKIELACRDNDAMTVLREILDFVAAVDVAIEFQKQHEKETLIVVTGSQETGGFTLGSNFGKEAQFLSKLLRQRMSAARFARFIAAELRRNPKATLEDFTATLAADWNLELPNDSARNAQPAKTVGPLKERAKKPPPEAKLPQESRPPPSEALLTAAEIEKFREALEETRKRLLGKDALAHGEDRDPFSMVVAAAFARRMGFQWTSREHTASWVPLFASGFGQERFGGLQDNAEIGQLLIDIVRSGHESEDESPADSASAAASAEESPASPKPSASAAGSAAPPPKPKPAEGSAEEKAP